MGDQLNTTSAAAGLFGRRPSFFTRNKSSHRSKHSRTLTPPEILDHDQPEPVPDSPRSPKSPPRRRHVSRHSLSEIGSTLRRSRSASLTSSSATNASSSLSHTRAPSATLALSLSPEKAAPAPSLRPALSISTFSRGRQKSTDNVKGLAEPASAVDNPKTPFGTMAVPLPPLRYPPSEKELQHALRYTPSEKEFQQAQQAQRSASFGSKFHNGILAPPPQLPMPQGASAHIIFQQIQELASKRISTLDYLRKAHEGRIYWFNTLLFDKKDLLRLPGFTPRNLARRATNYLLLGFSLPTILDLNVNSPTDYLRTLNALLVEFEQYQTIHPPDGSTASSLSRGRIPHMFKRTNLMGGKGRRSSSAAGDLPMLTPQSSFNDSVGSLESPSEELLLPNESYTHLQTPHIPFEPDFFSTFATLCDVLIDCYTRILGMLSTAESVSAASGGVPSIVGDQFSKADARIRKIILQGMVKEFEDSCRQGAKAEIGGVGKVVLGGLM